MTKPHNPDHQSAPADDVKHARKAKHAIADKHDQLNKKLKDAEDRQEALMDEGVEETFPASDPVSVKRIT